MIKKIVYKIVICFLLIINVGCTEVGKYSITNSKLNGYLTKYLGKPQSINIANLGEAEVTVNELDTAIGENNSEKIKVSGKMNISINSFLGKLSTDAAIKLDARPVYDEKNGTIFLKDLMIADYTLGDKIDAKSAAFVMPFLNKIIQLYFDTQPIYTLDAQNSKLEALVLKTGANMAVEQGKIVFSLPH